MRKQRSIPDKTVTSGRYVMSIIFNEINQQVRIVSTHHSAALQCFDNISQSFIAGRNNHCSHVIKCSSIKTCLGLELLLVNLQTYCKTILSQYHQEAAQGTLWPVSSYHFPLHLRLLCKAAIHQTPAKETCCTFVIVKWTSSSQKLSEVQGGIKRVPWWAAHKGVLSRRGTNHDL